MHQRHGQIVLTSQGFEICKALFSSSRAYHILMGVRGSASRADEPIANLKASSPSTTSTAEGLVVDIDSDESIAAAFDQVSSKYSHIDILINNAGANFGSAAAKGEMTQREAWLKAFNTNAAGTHIMTETFAPLLLKSKDPSPRLIFITSGGASLTEMAERRSPRWEAPAAGWPKATGSPTLAYRCSKVGMNMMYLDWVRVFDKDPVKVFCVSPGFLATGLGSTGAKALAAMGAADPAEGGNAIKDVVEGKKDERAGKVINARQGADEVQEW